MAEHGPEEIFLPETWSPNPDEILYVHETEGCSLTEVNINKYRLKRKDKNKSREEIFYQMKVFFC